MAIDALNLEPEFPRVSICSSVITDIELCNVRSRHSTRGSVLYMYIFCPRERNEKKEKKSKRKRGRMNRMLAEGFKAQWECLGYTQQHPPPPL